MYSFFLWFVLFQRCPNRVAERALPATIALHNALQSQLGVDNRIGATFGEVYCGAVGGVKRHGKHLSATVPFETFVAAPYPWLVFVSFMLWLQQKNMRFLGRQPI